MYAKDYVPAGKLSETIEALLLKYSDEQSCKRVMDRDRVQFRKTVIIPALKAFEESEFLSGIYNRSDRQDKFIKEHPDLETTRDEINKCVIITQTEES